MSILTQLPQVLQTVFTTVADTAGHLSHFSKRPDLAKFSARTWTQTVVLGWLAHPDATLDQLCQMASRLGVDVSPQALDQRFDPRSAACLEYVLHQAMTHLVAADPVAVPLLQRFTGVVIQDATTITLPHDFATRWPSCGGRTPTTPTAALKCGVQLDLLTGALRPLALASGRTQDQALAWAPTPFAPGTLRIADLGFFNFDAFASLAAQECYWLSRVRVNTTLTDADGRPWSLLTFVQQHLGHGGEASVRLGRRGLPGRLLVEPVPQEVADQRRRRMQQDARDKGQAVSDAALALADWTLAMTNVPADQLSVADALVLLRARWQIELLFKLWKSHGQIDQWRSQKPWRILCEVYAKLLAMLLQHWLLLVGCWAYPDRSLVKASRTIRGYAGELASALPKRRHLAQVLSSIQRCLAHHARLNPRRTHPNTYQLLLTVPDAYV